MQCKADQFDAVRDDVPYVCGEDAIDSIAGFRGDIEAEVFHPLQAFGRDGRLAEKTIALGGVVKGLTGIECWQCFRADRLASCEDSSAAKLDFLDFGWLSLVREVFKAAKCVFPASAEDVRVDSET